MDFLDPFLSECKSLTIDDVIHGFRGSMFGGTDEQKPFPWRGTPNIYEDLSSPYRFDNQGNFQNKGEWWLNFAPFMAVHYEIPFLLSIVYLIVIFGIQAYLKDRPAVTWLTNKHIACWNLVLCLLSVVGSYLSLRGTFIWLFVEGKTLASDICLPWPEWNNPWPFLFAISKIPELLDTVFLVLRKKPVIFLHWYHHITVMLYCWDGWAIMLPPAGAFATMNLIVHSIMYFYYFLMSQPFEKRIRLPSWVPFLITTLQISQMFGGLGILFFSLKHCNTSYLVPNFRLMLNLLLGIAMYFSYALLFTQFFIKRYFFVSDSSHSKSE